MMLLETMLKQDCNSVVISTNGHATGQNFYPNKQGNLKALRTALDCKMVQMVPATAGVLNGKATIWMDEEGAHKARNDVAEDLLGDQVHGGKLCGAVVLTHHSAEEEE